MIQISEGSTRALDERCLAFLKKYAGRIEVVDAKELGLSTIDAASIRLRPAVTCGEWNTKAFLFRSCFSVQIM